MWRDITYSWAMSMSAPIPSLIAITKCVQPTVLLRVEIYYDQVSNDGR